jgi:hypothetical protein
MRSRITVFAGLILGIAIALNVSGCSMFSGPTDEDVIRAVTETGLFSGGEEKFTLISPMVVVNKAMFSSNGTWEVKVKLHTTFMMAGGRETKPVEKVQSFIIAKVKDSTGNSVWKAEAKTR